MLTQLLQLQSDLDALEVQFCESHGLDYRQVVRRRRRRRRLSKRENRVRRRARVGTRRRLQKKKGKTPGAARRRVRKRLAKSPVRKGRSKYEELRTDFSLGSELIDLWDELIEAGTELVGTARDAARFAVPPILDEVLRTIVHEVRAGVISKAQAIRTALARGDVRRALGEVASVAVPNLDRFQSRAPGSVPRRLVYEAGVVRDVATGAVVRYVFPGLDRFIQEKIRSGGGRMRLSQLLQQLRQLGHTERDITDAIIRGETSGLFSTDEGADTVQAFAEPLTYQTPAQKRQVTKRSKELQKARDTLKAAGFKSAARRVGTLMRKQKAQPSKLRSLKLGELNRLRASILDSGVALSSDVQKAFNRMASDQPSTRIKSGDTKKTAAKKGAAKKKPEGPGATKGGQFRKGGGRKAKGSN